MRTTTLLLATLTSLVAADEWSYTGKPVPWSAGEVWTSPCTDYTFTYTKPSASGSDSKSYSATPSAIPSTWTTVYFSGASTWTTIATAAPVSKGDGYGSGSPAQTSTGAGGYGETYSSSGSEADTPAPTTTAGVDAATFTGAANQKVIGAGVVAAAGLALLL